MDAVDWSGLGVLAALLVGCVGYLARRIDRHEDATSARFDRTDARFDRLLDEMHARFAQVDARFAQVDARFDRLLDEMHARFAQVDARFDRLEERYVRHLELHARPHT